MKTFIGILLITLLSCSRDDFDCNRQIEDTLVVLMESGTFGDSKVRYSLERITNPYDWDYNTYFTGTKFSDNKWDVLKVFAKDTCELKQKYFLYNDDDAKKYSDTFETYQPSSNINTDSATWMSGGSIIGNIPDEDTLYVFPASYVRRKDSITDSLELENINLRFQLKLRDSIIESLIKGINNSAFSGYDTIEFIQFGAGDPIQNNLIVPDMKGFYDTLDADPLHFTYPIQIDTIK